MAFPEFQSVPITSFTGYHWETGSVSTSSHQIFICMNKIPFSGCFFPLPKECLISFLHCQVWWMPTPAQLPGSALWPSSSQMIHHHLKAEFHQLSLHTHAKSKICCGSSLPSPAILAPIFLPHLGRQILFLCSHLWLPKKIPSSWKPDPHCCCWPTESIHSFSAPPHLRRKQKTKIWAAYAQPQPVKPSGNICCAPEFLDWITGAHLEGDNCQWLERPQHPRTETLVSRKHPKAERWGLKPHGREASAAISHPSVAQMRHWTEFPAPLELLSCRWSRSLPPEARSHKFLHLPSWKSSFPTLISTDSQRALQYSWEMEFFCIFRMLEKNQSLSLWTTSEPAAASGSCALRPAAKQASP